MSRFCPLLNPSVLGEKGLGVLRWRLWPLREKDFTVTVSECVDVCLSLFFALSDEVIKLALLEALHVSP